MAVLNAPTPESNTRQHPIPSKKKPSKFGTAFKKVGKYLQQQAQEQSHSALYLSPRDLNHTQDTQYAGQDLLEYLSDDPSVLPYGVIPPIPSYTNTLHSHPASSSMSSDSDSDPGISQSITRHQYASDNILQSYDVLIPDRPPQDNNTRNSEPGYFLIFIHGGYFRDPKQTSKSFVPTIALLESSPPEIRNRITGYASLNYRLAPHPGYPQDPSTPSYNLNNARWPDQPNDILAALKHIQSHYPQGKRYILAGHSVGATLSFIAALRCADLGLIPPTTVLGICGIYDFPRIHRTNDGYESLTRNAMDPGQYVEASPALVDVQTYIEKWTVKSKSEGGSGKRGVLLAQPVTDELVGTDQCEVMADVFSDGQGKVADGFELETVDAVKGTHWQILENGELARCFGRAIGLVG